MIRFIYLCLFFLLSVSPNVFSFSSIVQDSFIVDLVPEKSNREISAGFHATMLHLSEPSTISTGIPGDTYRFYGTPQKRPLIINLDSKLPIPLAGKNWYNERSGLFFTFHAIPQYQTRIFRDDPSQGDSSRSVRTPSYIPGFNLFISHKKWWDRAANLQKQEQIKKHYFLMIRGFHHSNGQDQKEFNDDGTINTYNGNFGEGFVFEAGFGGYYIKKSNAIDSVSQKRLVFHPKKFKHVYQKQYNTYWRAGYEYHPVITERITTNKAFDQYDLLGRNILRLQTGFINCPKMTEYKINKDGSSLLLDQSEARERWRMVFNASYILDRKLNSGSIYDLQAIKLGNLGKRLNLDFTFYKKVYGSKYAAWFAQVGYYGSDPYNLYFQQSILFYRIGIAWSHFKF